MKTFRYCVSRPLSLIAAAFIVMGLAFEALSDLISGSRGDSETNWQERARPLD